MLAPCNMTWRLSVRLPQVGVLSKRLNASCCFFSVERLSSAYSTFRRRENSDMSKSKGTSLLNSVPNFERSPYLHFFAKVHRSLQVLSI